MLYLEIALFVVGLVLLIAGYRRNNRNMMLAAAIVLLLSAALEPFVTGLKAGYSGNQREHALTQPQPNNSFKPTPLRGAA